MERASTSISRVLVPPSFLPADTAPVPGLQPLFGLQSPARWLLLHTSYMLTNRSPRAKASPHRQPGQPLPLLGWAGHRQMLPLARHHLWATGSNTAQPSTTSLGQPHEHRRLKFTPGDVLELAHLLHP